jgi:acetyl esterase/lipase
MLTVTELDTPRTWSLYFLELIFYLLAARSFSSAHGARQMASTIVSSDEKNRRLAGKDFGVISTGISAPNISLLSGTPLNCPALVFEGVDGVEGGEEEDGGEGGVRRGGDPITLFYLHGGAFILPPSALQFNFVAMLIRRLEKMTSRRVRGILPLYPLALMRKEGVGPKETIDVIEDVLRIACDYSVSGPIVILGDSAGGGLALALAQRLARTMNRISQRVVSLNLFSPWCDVSLSLRKEMQTQEMTCCMLRIEGLAECGKLYCGGDHFRNRDSPLLTELQLLPLTDPEASPLFGSLEGLPSTSLFVGTYELLLPEGRALRDRMAASNCRIRYIEGKGMPHVWPLLPLQDAVPAVELLLQGIIDDVKRGVMS